MAKSKEPIPNVEPELEKILKEGSSLIEQINLDYNKYFNRTKKKPPAIARMKLERLITRARALLRLCRSHPLSFKIRNLLNQYMSYEALWDKKMRQLEKT
jgi:hypothetical protein